MTLNGSEIFAEVLLEQGVDTIFGYPGGAVLNLYDALYKYSDRINHVMTAHEQGASHAADGYARATGRTGVVLATSGPGATNLVTGIATAYMDSVPMVAFTGNVGSSLIGKDSFQEVYIAGITMPITKHNFVVRDVRELADTMREAFRIAQSGRKGPVLVDITKDVTAAVCEFENKPIAPLDETALPDDEDILAVAEAISKASRPVMLIGGGAAAAHQEVKALAEKLEIPVTYTLMAAGVLDYDNPLNLGLLGMHGNFAANKAVAEADLLLAVGTRFSDRVALNTDYFARKAVRIQIDIDASEINKNVSVDHALIGDAGDILRVLTEKVSAKDKTEWMEKIAGWKLKGYCPEDSETEIRPHQLVDITCSLAGPDAVYVTDVGQHQMWAAQYIHHVDSRRFLTSGGLGTMGYGYGAAIGAQTALGRDKTVIMMTGDGSFHMNLNEACTAVSYDLPIITIIFNNQVLGMVRQWQTTFYGKRYSSTDPHRKTDFVKLAEGFGLKGYHCETPEAFREALEDALKAHKPAWIECTIGKDEKVLPMIPGGKTVDDIIM